MKSNTVSSELCLVYHHNGIKLIDQEKVNSINKNKFPSVSTVFQLPHCVYFSNLQSKTKAMNEYAVEACGYDSLAHAIEKTIAEVATKETAKRVMDAHQEVINYNRIKIVEEDILRKDDLSFQCLSIIKPWFDHDNKIKGIFGCSILLNQQSLVTSLSELTDLGLLNSEPNHKTDLLIPGSQIRNIYFSKRETQCLRLYIRGKTAKQIANILNLSYRTIEHYLDNIKSKFGVSSKSELISLVFDLVENSSF